MDEAAIVGEADRDRVRLSGSVGGGEPGDPLPDEEGGLFGREDGGLGLHAALTASRTFGATSEAKRRMLASASSWVTPGSRPQKHRWS